MVEGEAQRQEHAALEDTARHGRVTDRPKENGVVAADLLDDACREGLAGGVPAPGAEVVGRRRDRHARRCGHGVEDFETFGDDLGADAVTADDGEVE